MTEAGKKRVKEIAKKGAHLAGETLKTGLALPFVGVNSNARKYVGKNAGKAISKTASLATALPKKAYNKKIGKILNPVGRVVKNGVGAELGAIASTEKKVTAPIDTLNNGLSKLTRGLRQINEAGSKLANNRGEVLDDAISAFKGGLFDEDPNEVRTEQKLKKYSNLIRSGKYGKYLGFIDISQPFENLFDAIISDKDGIDESYKRNAKKVYDSIRKAFLGDSSSSDIVRIFKELSDGSNEGAYAWLIQAIKRNKNITGDIFRDDIFIAVGDGDTSLCEPDKKNLNVSIIEALKSLDKDKFEDDLKGKKSASKPKPKPKKNINGSEKSIISGLMIHFSELTDRLNHINEGILNELNS